MSMRKAFFIFANGGKPPVQKNDGLFEWTHVLSWWSVEAMQGEARLESTAKEAILLYNYND